MFGLDTAGHDWGVTITDRRGSALSAATGSEAEAFDDALELFLNYEMAAGAAAKQVLADHPDSVMTTILRGYMMMMLETSALHPKVAATAAAGLDADGPNQRERLHLEALAAWSGGDVYAAAAAWDRALAADPFDLLALKMHHYTTFWTGRPQVLLAAVDGVIGAWSETTPGYDHVLGMRAFALNETGRYEDAEAVGRDALARNDEDLWSVHAVAHALEMQGDHRRGDAFFTGERDRWATKNPFVGHVWWHAALFAWNGGDYHRVLDLYDSQLRPASTEFFLDIQNLASLLTRLELSGVDVGDRWDELGDHAAARIADHVLAFTDVHCALSLARTGRIDDLQAFRASLAAHLASQTEARSRRAVDVALAVTDSLLAAATGEAEAAATTLWTVRGDLAPIGGSLAQRDLFDLVLADLTNKAGDAEMTVYLLANRTERWPHSAPTWQRFADALTAAGHDERAKSARTRAAEVASV